jgi:hypothetical protein
VCVCVCVCVIVQCAVNWDMQDIIAVPECTVRCGVSSCVKKAVCVNTVRSCAGQRLHSALIVGSVLRSSLLPTFLVLTSVC